MFNKHAPESISSARRVAPFLTDKAAECMTSTNWLKYPASNSGLVKQQCYHEPVGLLSSCCFLASSSAILESFSYCLCTSGRGSVHGGSGTGAGKSNRKGVYCIGTLSPVTGTTGIGT